MTDEEFEIQRKRIQTLANEWIGPLGLKWWKTKWEYERGDLDRADCGSSIIATTSADWRYLEATIRWAMSQVAKLSDEELEDVVVHELGHILVNEMRTEGIDHEERVVSTLANAFIWLRDDCKRRYLEQSQKQSSDDVPSNDVRPPESSFFTSGNALID